MKKSVQQFGFINTVEGYSYLILLFIAMPLKYMAGIAIATKIAGMIHGVLFIAFCYLLIVAWKEAQWKTTETILYFVASLVPFGTFFTKKRIKSYE